MLAKVAMRLAAEQVRLIYRRYLELSGVNALRLRKMMFGCLLELSRGANSPPIGKPQCNNGNRRRA